MRGRRAGPRALVLAAALLACGPGPRDPRDRDRVGSAACRRCHADIAAAWAGSLHAHAAGPAVPDRVQAPFDGRRVTGATASVVVRTRGGRLEFQPVATGELVHRPALVLGRAAVEQYLVPREGGRLQAFPLAYDSGAGEWFDLFPEGPGPQDWTHWTGPGATANSQCLECHVTGYEKGYDPARDRYRSRWTELGVGCEACHGPGARHVRAREARTVAGDPYAESRLRSTDACMPCHSLRVVIAEGWEPGAPLADHFDPELLDSEAWTADGQLRAEAYEWTSFQMSRMAAAGVVCQDCHEPHAGRLREVGNALCLRCHDRALGTEAHTHHPGTSAGGACVDCHMPEHVFMERDRRRDHAFTRPDPTRARALGAPDACTACHRDRDRVWAAERVATWYGAGDDARRAARALAVLLEAGRRGAPAVAEPLRRVLASDLDSMRRASAARFLADMTEAPDVVEALRQAAADREPFVRAAAVRALGEVAARPEVRATLVAATRDARRLVRIEAAFALAGTSLEGLDRSARATIDQAFGEWLAAQAPTSDLPETHFNQGVFWARRGDVEQAEAAYRRAIALWPPDLAPRQNLAMLLVETGRPGDAAREFEDLLWRAPASPGAAHRLAEARLAAGDERAAARAFEQATRDPTSRRAALRALVRLAHRWNDQAMAARWLPEALLADPATANDPDVRRALGLPAAAPAGAPAP